MATKIFKFQNGGSCSEIVLIKTNINVLKTRYKLTDKELKEVKELKNKIAPKKTEVENSQKNKK